MFRLRGAVFGVWGFIGFQEAESCCLGSFPQPLGFSKVYNSFSRV